MSASPQKFLSLPAVARQLGVSEAPIRSRIARGEITPDAVGLIGAMRGETPLFAEGSVPRIRRLLFEPSSETSL